MSGGGSLGLGKSKTESESSGYSTSDSGQVSTQDIAFKDLYAKLFGGASDAATAGLADPAALGAAAKSLFSGGANLFDELGSPSDAGSSYMDQRLNGTSPVLQNQIDVLSQNLGKTFREQLMPAGVQSGVESGTLGNDREGVFLGMGADSLLRSFSQGVTSLQSADQNQKDSIAAQVAGNSLQGAATGLGALPTLFDSLINSTSPELGIFANLSKIMGGPQALTTSEAFSKSFGQNSSTSSGRAWNFNTSGGGGVGYGGTS